MMVLFGVSIKTQWGRQNNIVSRITLFRPNFINNDRIHPNPVDIKTKRHWIPRVKYYLGVSVWTIENKMKSNFILISPTHVVKTKNKSKLLHVHSIHIGIIYIYR